MSSILVSFFTLTFFNYFTCFVRFRLLKYSTHLAQLCLLCELDEVTTLQRLSFIQNVFSVTESTPEVICVAKDGPANTAILPLREPNKIPKKRQAKADAMPVSFQSLFRL